MKNLVLVLFLLCFMLQGNVYAVNVGDVAPDFSVEDLNGNRIVLNSLLENKGAVIVFWTTWCPTCKKEIPFVEEFYDTNKDKVAVLGINAGETKEKVSGFVQKTEISYPVAVDPKNEIVGLYKIVGVPTIVAIDKDGKIVYVGHSIDEMKETVSW